MDTPKQDMGKATLPTNYLPAVFASYSRPYWRIFEISRIAKPYHHGFPLEFVRNSSWSLIKAISIKLLSKKMPFPFGSVAKSAPINFICGGDIETSIIIRGPDFILNEQLKLTFAIFLRKRAVCGRTWTGYSRMIENGVRKLARISDRPQDRAESWRKSENMAKMTDYLTNSPALA